MTKNFVIVLSYILLLFSSYTFAQKSKTIGQSIDIQSYDLRFAINDSTDIIEALAEIEIKLLENIESVKLDLAGVNEASKGMFVAKVHEDNKPARFIHQNDILEISIDENSKNKIRRYKIWYKGEPADGLIIGKNIYGNRTFFGDNWPNRAKNWIPCIDHPLDKAEVRFKIEAPSKYQVVANGKLIEKTNLENGKILHIYYSKAPIPTKVMVFGAAEFAIKHHDTISNIPVTSWVYPQNKKTGFKKFNITADALSFFIKRISSYPFAKLANVQSSTIFGGMENAGTIFYPERRVAGSNNIESTVVHEIAHQWFGNSATETDFAHLWLSEGFATYLTNLYMEHKYGKESTGQLLSYQRNRIINFYKRNQSPVVDTLNYDYMSLLNANSYQKGSWILHMLRRKVGDDVFWQILREYYQKYKFVNASSNDFIGIAEKTSGKQLRVFFKQWLYQAGHPKLKYNWKQQDTNLIINIKQVQKNQFVFKFPLDIKIVYENSSAEILTLRIESIEQIHKLKLEKKLKIKNIVLDPDLWLLYEKG